MNKGQLLDLLSNPRPISKSDAEGLKHVLQAYPYFTAANYLLTKFYHEQDDFQYQQQLKVTATQTNNRTSLYKLIHENVPAREAKVEAPKSAPVQEVPAVSVVETTHPIASVAESSTSREEENHPIDVVDINTVQEEVELAETKEETQGGAVSIGIEESHTDKEEESVSFISEEESDKNEASAPLMEITEASEDVVIETATENSTEPFESTEVDTTLPIIPESTENNAAAEPTQEVDEAPKEETQEIEEISSEIEEADFHESEDQALAADDEVESAAEDTIQEEEILITVAEDVVAEPQRAATSIENEVRKERNSEKTIEELQQVIESNSIKHKVDLNILTTAIETNLDVSSVAPASILDDGSEHSFLAWLKRPNQGASQAPDVNTKAHEELLQPNSEESTQQLTNTEHLAAEHPLEEKTPIAEETADTASEANEIPAEKPSPTSTKTTKIDKAKAVELLDKFIETQPKMSKAKVDFYSPVNMAKQSVADHDELATETLATIYMAQSNYLKAIKVYESLIYKFPDKEAYFKKLIKKAKDRMQPKK